MNALDQLLEQIKVEANVFHNGQYCGNWAIDTSGNQQVNFHVVSHGQCYVSTPGENFELQQGDAIFFPKDTKHSLSNTPTPIVPTNQQESGAMSNDLGQDITGLVCGTLISHHPLFNKLLEPLPDYIIIQAKNLTPCSAITQLILTESKTTQSHHSLMLNRLSDCLFHYLLRSNLAADQGVFAASTHPKLSKAMQEIHQNIEKKHTVDSLAQAAGMSRSSFATQFKQTTQLSPMDYVTQWRMLCAYRWLADEQITVLEAATRCGYETESSFSKAFSRVVGMGPGQVRAGLHH